MSNFGPPPGCECSNYFELNGKLQHEDECPCAQTEDALVDWAERQILEEKTFEMSDPDEDLEADAYDLILDSVSHKTAPPPRLFTG